MHRLAWVAILLGGCTSNTLGRSDGGADLSVVINAVDGGLNTEGSNAEFGLDTRPANPTCTAPMRPVVATTLSVGLSPAFPNLQLASPMVARRGKLSNDVNEPMRWFIAERSGTVWTFVSSNASKDGRNGSERVAQLLKINVNAGGEGGLLGFDLDPQFADNHRVYVSYTGPSQTGNCQKRGNDWDCSQITRFTITPGANNTFTQSAEEILYQLAQPYSNHDGGDIHFGPDGFLYIGFGDGGSGGDPECSGQQLKSPLGKLLRIDPRSVASGYAIPSDNPFATAATNCHTFNVDKDTQRSENCPEIYAWGIRNPFRFAFDSVPPPGVGPGAWVADVGQDRIEEVDWVQKGKNYGWNRKEGTRDFSTNCTPADTSYVAPVVEYDQTGSSHSVIIGGIYRGTAIPALAGRLVFADYGTGRIWSLADPYTTTMTVRNPMPLLTLTTTSIVGFAEDESRELYVIVFDNTAGRGMQKLVATNPPMAESNFPSRLSSTGCMNPANPSQPGAGLIPYDINAPFWSDGAEKQRWVAIPDGAKIHIQGDGDWDLPIGSVLVKQFKLGGALAETRLLVRHSDGDWAGYTYVWDAAQTDALLIDAREERMVGGQRWVFPSRSDCLACHTDAAGRSLGLETGQLNRVIDYGNDRRANQLKTFEHIGLLDAPLPANDALAILPSPTGNAPLDERARAYLHSNCSHCHRPGATASNTEPNLLYGAPDARICNLDPSQGNLGIAGAKLLLPGDPSKSLLSVRMTRTDETRMPKVGSIAVDTQGVMLIESWIRSLAACP